MSRARTLPGLLSGAGAGGRPLARLSVRGLVLAAALGVGGVAAARAAGGSGSPGWPDEVLEPARTIPLQTGGRVMPLDTYAGFTLLRLNHKRSCTDGDGRTLDAMTWLLDVLARPERARTYRCFKIDNDEVLEAVGFRREDRRKSDRWSFDELAAARGPLRDQARAIMRARPEAKSKDRTPVENGVLELSAELELFDALTRYLDFARPHLPVPPGPKVAALWPGRTHVSPLDVLERAGDLRAVVGDAPHGAADAAPAPGSEAAGVMGLFDAVQAALSAAHVLALIPPEGTTAASPEWLSPGAVLYESVQGGQVPEAHVSLVLRLASFARAAGEAGASAAEIRALLDESVALATRRGEYDKVPLEVRLSRLDPFYRSLGLYLLAFLIVAASWAWPRRWVRGGAWAVLLAASALHLTGIVMRCVLRERPPVLNLYDTTLFITWVGVAACLVEEAIHRRGIGLSLSAVFGGLGLFIANSFEALEGRDTMQPLVAVLDTNFWLATHVTTISIGYTGGLVASLVAHVHVLGRALGVKRDDPGFYALLSRLTYGMLGFALLFSVVGTILGGIWANESWGRFWGWDPKENGALMICLSQLAILHARLGGLLRPFGVALATIGQGLIVAFSWWGVNLLGIGLHSYGFTGGLMTGLMAFYGLEAAVLLVGTVVYLLGRAYGAPRGGATAA